MQCLKWTVAQSPNATNILSLAQQKACGGLPKRPLKIVVLPKPDINIQR
jgi:hypothetical protein